MLFLFHCSKIGFISRQMIYIFKDFLSQTYRFLLTHVKKRILQKLTFTHVRQYVALRFNFPIFQGGINPILRLVDNVDCLACDEITLEFKFGMREIISG